MTANHQQLGCQHILGVSPPLHFSLHSHAYELCKMEQAAMLGVLGAPSHLPLHAISHAVWLSITVFQYFIEPFSLQVATIPGSAEPSPTAVRGTGISVIWLPMLTAVARLRCAK